MQKSIVIPQVVFAVLIGYGIIARSADVCLNNTDPYNAELIRRLRLETIRREILYKLRFTQPPNNPDKPIVVSPDVLSEYEAIAKAQDLISSGRGRCTQYNHFAHERLVFFPTEINTIRIHQHISNDLTGEIDTRPVDSYRLKFELDLRGKTFITGSELRLYKKPRSSTASNITGVVVHTESRVEVHVITYPKNYYGEELRRFFRAIDVGLQGESYVTFDMISVVRDWLEMNKSSRVRGIELLVQIRCPESVDGETQFLPGIEFAVDNNRTIQFIVDTYNNSDRQRRQVPNSHIDSHYCVTNPDQVNCCLRSLEINFKRDFNWSWIIEPKSFYANYCEGLCPQYWGHAVEHSWIISTFLQNNPTAAPDPCCVPDSFVPLPLLILTHEGVPMKYALEDVKVDSCICR